MVGRWLRLGASWAAIIVAIVVGVRAPRQRPELTAQVGQILAARCVRCHGALKVSGGLRVDTVEALLRGGDSGPAIVPGRPRASLLLARVAAHEMPKDGVPLSDGEVALLDEWIDLAAAPRPDGRLAVHWAFEPQRLPALPATGHPIDAFVDQQLRTAKIRCRAPPAERRLLLRRLSLDLTGLPPTEDEYRRLMDDAAADSYERAVDRLLASPRYGERWGRHFMDLWRYSSHEHRVDSKNKALHSSPHIWRWRDYLIRALQEDRGLDRMIVEMFAGDQRRDAPDDALAATGYLVRSQNTIDRDSWLTNVVDHAGRAFLGLSLGCARCHDHKFDPISQKEFYQLRSYFEPYVVQTDGDVAHAVDGPVVPTHLFLRGDPRAPDPSVAIQPQVPAVPGHVACCDHLPAPSTGRRLALARWLVSDTNPLVARVLVNHVWLRHFGRGLVEVPDEFGVRSRPPTHPELLDWLAVEWRKHGWSLKWLHRTIVTSAAYRRSSSSAGLDACVTKDPQVRLYWRFPTRRAEAEVIRDSLLHLAGALDPTIGGPEEATERADDSPRRSLYFRTSRRERVPFLDVFDAARVEECYRRSETIVPQQSLALLNSPFVWRQARLIADRHGGDHDFVPRMFALVLGREAEPAEAALGSAFLAQQELLLGNPAQARAYLVHGLLNHNDFVTIR